MARNRDSSTRSSCRVTPGSADLPNMAVHTQPLVQIQAPLSPGRPEKARYIKRKRASASPHQQPLKEEIERASQLGALSTFLAFFTSTAIPSPTPQIVDRWVKVIK